MTSIASGADGLTNAGAEIPGAGALKTDGFPKMFPGWLLQRRGVQTRLLGAETKHPSIRETGQTDLRSQPEKKETPPATNCRGGRSFHSTSTDQVVRIR